jgi:hypothetical protein
VLEALQGDGYPQATRRLSSAQGVDPFSIPPGHLRRKLAGGGRLRQQPAPLNNSVPGGPTTNLEEELFDGSIRC